MATRGVPRTSTAPNRLSRRPFCVWELCVWRPAARPRARLYVCGFALLVLSAPARAILSRSGLGAAYETLVGACFFDFAIFRAGEIPSGGQQKNK